MNALVEWVRRLLGMADRAQENADARAADVAAQRLGVIEAREDKAKAAEEALLPKVVVDEVRKIDG